MASEKTAVHLTFKIFQIVVVVDYLPIALMNINLSALYLTIARLPDASTSDAIEVGKWTNCLLRFIKVLYLFESSLVKPTKQTTKSRLCGLNFSTKMVDYLKKALIYGHTSRISS